MNDSEANWGQTVSIFRYKCLNDIVISLIILLDNSDILADNSDILAGLKMLSAIDDVNSETNLDVSIRVGIHTGSVLCGVVGIKRFR